MPIVEQFNTDANVCDTQDKFNVAFDKALKQNNKDSMKKTKPWVYVYMTLWMIFFIWALVLAMQVHHGPNRIVHLVFAMAFSPLYVLAYYLGALNDGKSMGMGMGRFY